MIARIERELTKDEQMALASIAPVTHLELSKLLGISTSRVDQLEKRALRKLAEEFPELGASPLRFGHFPR